MHRRAQSISSTEGLDGESGVVALEFAITAPLLMLIMLGAMAFALHFAILVAVIHAASEGARASISGESDGDRNTAAVQRVQGIFKAYGPLLPPSQATVTAGPGTTAGTYKVTVNYDPKTFDLNAFYRYWGNVSGQDQGSGSSISYTATVANGGY